MDVVGPQEMRRVLEVVDALGIHREAVRIPLTPVPGGGVCIEAGALVVEVPLGDELDAFLDGLPARARGLSGFDALPPMDAGP